MPFQYRIMSFFFSFNKTWWNDRFCRLHVLVLLSPYSLCMWFDFIFWKSFFVWCHFYIYLNCQSISLNETNFIDWGLSAHSLVNYDANLILLQAMGKKKPSPSSWLHLFQIYMYKNRIENYKNRIENYKETNYILDKKNCNDWCL